MIKAFLIMEKGLLEERVYPLEERLTIGRSPLNVVHLPDPSVSRRHAALYSLGGKTIVEDLGSHNGTYVNGERVFKAVLKNGDTLRVGKVILHYREQYASEEEPNDITQEIIRTTQELLQGGDELADVKISMAGKDGTSFSHRSRRLSETLSRIPIFAPLDDETLSLVAHSARLLVFDRGRTVFRQGDRGSSLYVVLDGKVRVVTYDHEGRELELAIIGENQFFGEMAFFSGKPRSATVQVLEESILCELSFQMMLEVVRRVPQVRSILESYYNERLQDTLAKKKAAGIVDRRKQPRLNERLPVSFSTVGVLPSHIRGRIFRSTSQDISQTGIRIKVQDRALMSLPAGCQLRLEIGLPQGWGTVKALGILRNIVDSKEGGDLGYLGIEFLEMASGHKNKLMRFIRGEALPP
ncbi:MAG: cyclic nucleotide-binding domain-containing protein [bacterium]